MLEPTISLNAFPTSGAPAHTADESETNVSAYVQYQEQNRLY